MLYRSTRNKLDSYTAHRALCIDRAEDGGFVLPIRIPVFSAEKLSAMRKSSLLQNIADILNIFFNTGITAWDLEAVVGKTPVQLIECGQKVIVAQCWKNPASKIGYYEQSIFALLRPELTIKPAGWLKVAIRISLMAAAILQLSEKEVDVAVNAGDFNQFLAAYYCRAMGVPIRKILVGCNENSNIWDFVYRSTIQCGVSLQRTAYPDQDKIIPDLFEAYIFLAYGLVENRRFLNIAADKQTYQLPEDAKLPVNDNLFVSVVGQERIPAVINSFRSNNGVIVNPYTAFSLGAMQDYRAKAGESSPTVVFEETAP